MDVVVFDCEAQGPSFREQTFALAVVCELPDEFYTVYKDPNMLGERLNNADLVIGFNHLRYDYPLLAKSGVDVQAAEDWDLYDALDRRYATSSRGVHTQAALCYRTLNIPDEGPSGAEVPAMIERGDWEAAERKCWDDVKSLVALARHARLYGHVTNGMGESVSVAVPGILTGAAI